MKKLNVGCGGNLLPGYDNIDPYIVRNKVINTFSWKLPYEDEEVEEIYLSHVIEHLSFNALDLTLKEFKRVLIPNGKLIIICPDLEKTMKKWLNSNYSYRWGFGLTTIFGNQKHTGQLHKNGFTISRFKKLLPKYGFEIKEIKNQHNRHKRDRTHIPLGDIYVEAIKK